MRRAVSRLFRTLAHGGSFGLSCVLSVICRARPLWPSASPDGKLVTLQWRTGTRAAPCNCDVTSNSQLRSLFTKHRIGSVRLSMSRENPLRPFSSSFFLLSLFFSFFPFSSFLLLSFFLLFLTSYLPLFLFLLPPSSAESLRR